MKHTDGVVDVVDVKEVRVSRTERPRLPEVWEVPKGKISLFRRLILTLIVASAFYLMAVGAMAYEGPSEELLWNFGWHLFAPGMQVVFALCSAFAYPCVPYLFRPDRY